MTRDTGAPRLQRAVQGDLDAFAQLAKEDHASLRAWASTLPRLVLHRADVVTVLTALRRGSASPELIQRWASFVRTGYLAGVTHGPITPLLIDYEKEYEDAIVEVVGRLDELGDIVDGEIDDIEIEMMLESLVRS